MRPSLDRSDRGLTRLESSLVTSLFIIVLAVAALSLARTYAQSVSSSGQGTGQGSVAVAQAPIAVSVPAAGTVAAPPNTSKGDRADACPRLRGRQPSGFDCTLPVFVPALDLSAVRVKAPYQCADPANYRLVKGQTIQRDKKCVLKTAKAGRS